MKKLKGYDRTFLTLALVFSLAGDVTLDIDRTRLFILGLVFFLTSHIFYIILLAKFIKFRKGRTIPVILVLIYTTVIALLLKDMDPDRMIAVYLYLAIISVMTLFAWVYITRGRFAHGILIPLGASVFMLSDTIIAVNQFLNPIPNSLVFSLSLYFTAQYLLVRGFTSKT